jgi:hypothetical protein
LDIAPVSNPSSNPIPLQLDSNLGRTLANRQDIYFGFEAFLGSPCSHAPVRHPALIEDIQLVVDLGEYIHQ